MSAHDPPRTDDDLDFFGDARDALTRVTNGGTYSGFHRDRADIEDALSYGKELEDALWRIAEYRHSGSFRVAHYDALKRIAREAIT